MAYVQGCSKSFLRASSFVGDDQARQESPQHCDLVHLQRDPWLVNAWFVCSNLRWGVIDFFWESEWAMLRHNSQATLWHYRCTGGCKEIKEYCASVGPTHGPCGIRNLVEECCDCNSNWDNWSYKSDAWIVQSLLVSGHHYADLCRA